MSKHIDECNGSSETVLCAGHKHDRSACIGFEPNCCSCFTPRKMLTRVSLPYQGIGRKALRTDPLPHGALPVYDVDVEVDGEKK